MSALTAVNRGSSIRIVNRSGRIDSPKSLDAILRAGHTPRMEQDRSRHFVRRDPARNMNRFYRLTVTRDLFGKTLLLREWGRIGVYCRSRADEKTNLVDAERDAAKLAAQKMRRGYVPVHE